MTDLGTDRDAARVAWSAMCDLVLDNRRRQQVSEAVGLPFGRLRALRRVAPAPMTMGELAAAIGVDAPNCTPVVDDLEARGLVERRPHPTDRRSRLVAATSEGVARRRQGQPHHGATARRPRRALAGRARPVGRAPGQGGRSCR